MTLSGFRRRLRQIRARGDEAGEEGGELSLVPYLDIVTNIMLFLMATVTFSAALGDLRASAPATGPGPSDRPAVTVSISAAGFTVATPGRVAPLIAGRDYAALAAEVTRARREQPSAKLVVNADPLVRYEDLVAVMDACRTPGAPDEDVLLSAGVE